MKVLLINPPWPGKGFGTRSQNRIIKQRADKYLQFPLFLGYASAILRKDGHQVFYIDSVVQEMGEEETYKKVEKLKPDVILMETTTPSIEYDFQSIKKMKEITGAFMIVVGPHVSYFPKESLAECESIDVIIKGEFDWRVSDVVKNKDSLENLKGIAYRKDGKIFDTGVPPYCENLDSLPFPDRETIPLDWYGEPWWNKRPFANMFTSRGCPYQCTFCLWPNIIDGRRWRTRSIDNVMAEIREMVHKYGVKEINIDDATFVISKPRLMEFCKRLNDEKIKIIWTCNSRVDTIDEEMIIAMKKSGCKMIRYGIESGSEHVLKSIKKGISFEQMEKAVALTREHGIMALGGFMFGFPEDTKESIGQTLDLAKKLKFDMIQTSIVLPYPGSRLYDECKEKDVLTAKSWKDYDMTHGLLIKPKDFDRAYLDGILSKMYKEFYFRPGFVVQTILNMRSGSDIARNWRSFKSLVKTILFHSKKREECGC